MNIHHITLIALTLSSALTGQIVSGQTASARLAAPKRVEVITTDDSSEPLLAQAVTAKDEIIFAQPQEPKLFSDQESFFVENLGNSPRTKTLIVRTGDADPKSTTALEEDLNIMSRVLGKAVKENIGNEDGLTAMGMKIRALAWPIAGSGIQNLYLDGYGAVFFLNVRFPLVAPPQKADGQKSKESTDSTWEEAKRELYGVKEATGMLQWLGDKNLVEYDAKKVAKLKDGLLNAIKNATHIRNLRPEEFVTVTVIGPDGPASMAVSVAKPDTDSDPKTKGARVSTRIVRAKNSSGESILTLRAKKSDIDAFAKGTLSLENFKERVLISAY